MAGIRWSRRLTVATACLLLAACGVGQGPLVSSLPNRMSAASRGQQKLLIRRKPGSLRPGQERLMAAAAESQPLQTLGYELVAVPTGMDPQRYLASLRQDPGIDYVAAPIPVRRPHVERRRKPPLILPLPQLNVSTGDPLSKDQYGLATTQVSGAWKVTRGAKRIILAVVDTGIDTKHPDLAAKLIEGYSTIGGSHNYKDEDGHGTHCAGVAAALTGNGIGIAGMAPDVRVMPVRVLDAEGEGSDEQIARGILWAANHHADVISLSVGMDEDSRVLKDAVNYALKKGCILVAAMGNDNSGAPEYPAAYPGVIAVSAVDAADAKADFSNYGNWCSVAAPGVDILSTMPTYPVSSTKEGSKLNYDKESGTSMATPCVAGLAALIKSRWPELGPAAVKQKIEATADDIGKSGYDREFGHGRINAMRALTGF